MKFNNCLPAQRPLCRYHGRWGKAVLVIDMGTVRGARRARIAGCGRLN